MERANKKAKRAIKGTGLEDSNIPSPMAIAM
jgi:hypothetical protein